MAGYVMELRKQIGTRPIINACAGAILVNGQGEILLQQRTDNGCWAVPGGAMELGESFEETARREVFEETGFIVGKLDFLCLNSGRHTFHRYPNGDEVYLACVIFTSTDFSGEIKFQKDETADLQWFHPNNLPANINQNDRHPIKVLIEILGS
ncbi:NUDIX hydrolase [Alicyclobacillus fodiniaquatilis]|uniref:NUDIX hydrolase n=1 Tax=Alicyclobacillus fodiniaquatilis TaxID=1661150 RepID=A0ABW4JKC0_9BACL